VKTLRISQKKAEKTGTISEQTRLINKQCLAISGANEA
jgi:hypothetical protein